MSELVSLGGDKDASQSSHPAQHYEPVFVGNVEDAFCATMLNGDLGAVVINEGFSFRSRHDAPVLRTLSATIEQKFKEHSELSALQLAQLIKRVRGLGDATPAKPLLDLLAG